MEEHTYQDRLGHAVSCIQGMQPLKLLPSVLVTGVADDRNAFEALLSAYRRQRYPHRCLVVIVPNKSVAKGDLDNENIAILELPSSDHVLMAELINECQFVAAMVSKDYYGPNYITDLALATRYTDASVVTKNAYYMWSSSVGLELLNAGSQYRLTSGKCEMRASLVRAGEVAQIAVREWARDHHDKGMPASKMLGIDEFNYCRNGGSHGFSIEQTDAVCDLMTLDWGLRLANLFSHSASIKIDDDEVSEWNFGRGTSKPI